MHWVVGVGVVSGVTCVLAGASAGVAQAPTATVRDSAGVRLVEHGAILPLTPQLRLGRVLARIGGVSDDPRYEFDGRSGSLTGALRGDGGIVTAAATEVRAYDATGQWQWSFGRAGGAPGEFRRIGWVCTFRGDSMVVHDPLQRRVTYLTPDGRLVAVVRLRNAAVFGCLEDGAVVVQAGSIHPLPDRRGEAPFVIHHRDGREVSLGVLPYRGRTHFERAAPFPTGWQVIVADPFAFLLTAYGGDGQVRMRIRTGDPLLPMSRQEYEQHIRLSVPLNATASEREFILRNARENLEIPTHWPILPRAIPGPPGWAWYAAPWGLGYPPAWTLFGPDGVARGRLQEVRPTWSRSGTLLAFGSDRALGLYRDHDGAAHFVVFALERVTPPTRNP